MPNTDGALASPNRPVYDIGVEFVAFPRKRTAVVEGAIAAAKFAVEQRGDPKTLSERRLIVNLVKTIRHRNLRKSIE